MNKFYLIDNDIFYLSSLQSQLRAMDCQVCVNHGDTGFHYSFRDVLREQPDAIIMDLIHPSFEGLELLHKLEEDHYTNSIPVFVYTKEENKDMHMDADNKGCEQFFIKERLSPEQLIKRIIKIYLK